MKYKVILRDCAGVERSLFSSLNEVRARNYYNNLIFDLLLYGTADRLCSHELLLVKVDIRNRKKSDTRPRTTTELVSGGWYPNQTLEAMGIL